MWIIMSYINCRYDKEIFAIADHMCGRRVSLLVIFYQF